MAFVQASVQALIASSVPLMLAAFIVIDQDPLKNADDDTLMAALLSQALITFFRNPPAGGGGAAIVFPAGGTHTAEYTAVFSTNLIQSLSIVDNFFPALAAAVPAGGGAVVDGKFKPLALLMEIFHSITGDIIVNGEFIFRATHQLLFDNLHDLCKVHDFLNMAPCVNIVKYGLSDIVTAFKKRPEAQELIAVLRDKAQWAEGHPIFNVSLPVGTIIGAKRCQHLFMTMFFAAAAATYESFAASSYSFPMIAQLLATKTVTTIAQMGDKAVTAEKTIGQEVELAWGPIVSAANREPHSPLQFPAGFVPKHVQLAAQNTDKPHNGVPPVGRPTCNICGHSHNRIGPHTPPPKPHNGNTEAANKTSRKEKRFEDCPFKAATNRWSVHPDDLANAASFVEGTATHAPRFVRRPQGGGGFSGM